MMVNLISEEQVRACADVAEVIGVIRDAFLTDPHARFEMPLRTQLDLVAGVLLLMPCRERTTPAAGMKIVTVGSEAGVDASYLLLDPTTGKTLAVMEANYLTDLRTAATSAIATDLLARTDVEVLGIFGAGRQATAHLTVLPQVRSFRRFLVCGSPGSDVGIYCNRIRREHGIALEAVNPATCASESDVLCTCTTATSPLFDGARLRPGTHLNLVGAFRPHTREVDDETVKRARIVVDSYQGALAEAGDLLIPLGNGSITRSQIVADLHELVSGKKSGRATPEDITIFKSVGGALEDLAAALLVYKKVATAR